jgi:hypothetical protein
MTSIDIKGNSGSVVIRVKDYERPNADDESDANWLVTSVEVTAGQLSGGASLSLETHDFVRFAATLDETLRDLKGKAVFQTCEDGLYFEIEMGSLGNAKICGKLRDRVTQSELMFQFDTDQTYLSQSKIELTKILQHFPVRTYLI